MFTSICLKSLSNVLNGQNKNIAFAVYKKIHIEYFVDSQNNSVTQP